MQERLSIVVSDPPHWIEQGHFKGPKFDKIVEIITALNGLDINDLLAGVAAGDIIYWNGSAWAVLTRGSDNQFLRSSSSSILWETVAIPTAPTYATYSTATGTATFSGGSLDQSITYLSVGATFWGGKTTAFTFRLNNTSGSVLTYYFYVSVNDSSWSQISTGTIAIAGFAALLDNTKRYSANQGNDIRYRITTDYTGWNTSNYTHATLKTGYLLETW